MWQNLHVTRDRCVNARQTLGSLLSEPSRVEARDLVFRPMRLSISSFRLLLAFARQHSLCVYSHSLACSLCVRPAPPTSGSEPLGAKLFSSSDLRSGPSGRRGTLVSGRFRGAQASRFRTTFQAFFAGPAVLFCRGLTPMVASVVKPFLTQRGRAAHC